MTKEHALALLYQALATPLGLILPTSNLTLARARLYAARRESGDPELDRLEFRQGPDDPNEVWITKKEPLSVP